MASPAKNRKVKENSYAQCDKIYSFLKFLPSEQLVGCADRILDRVVASSKDTLRLNVSVSLATILRTKFSHPYILGILGLDPAKDFGPKTWDLREATSTARRGNQEEGPESRPANFRNDSETALSMVENTVVVDRRYSSLPEYGNVPFESRLSHYVESASTLGVVIIPKRPGYRIGTSWYRPPINGPASRSRTVPRILETGARAAIQGRIKVASPYEDPQFRRIESRTADLGKKEKEEEGEDRKIGGRTAKRDRTRNRGGWIDSGRWRRGHRLSLLGVMTLTQCSAMASPTRHNPLSRTVPRRDDGGDDAFEGVLAPRRHGEGRPLSTGRIGLSGIAVPDTAFWRATASLFARGRLEKGGGHRRPTEASNVSPVQRLYEQRGYSYSIRSNGSRRNAFFGQWREEPDDRSVKAGEGEGRSATGRGYEPGGSRRAKERRVPS
ncbi:hypothetical protein KM043_008912 [Ampulex compressa]|nr:hypothetical protein KM043_008912 [Ampulex compressa]